MKNEKMVRTYGRKDLYFTNHEAISRFVNMYKDLFITAFWNQTLEEKFKVWERELDNGEILYELWVDMDHNEFRKIEKDLNIKRKKFTFVHRYFNTEHFDKKCVRFVC